MHAIPEFWKTDLNTLERLAQTARRARVRVLCRSAGGQPVYAFCYGEKQPIAQRANYSSACGAHDLRAYCPAEPKKPVVILLGAVHGGETEGTAAMLNLIQLMETGRDWAGEEHPALMRAAEAVRLVLAPVCNPDGRARFAPDACLGMKNDEHRRWMQGAWKDGALCGWPGCKRIHPIKNACGFLGGYFNDDGVNLMHDNFFRPMARETQAILDLCDEEHADWALHLHGGSNSLNELLQPRYVPLEVQRAVYALAERCDAAAREQGLRFTIAPMPEREQGETPPSFNLVSACHHICGCVSATFESNECIVDLPGPKLTHEEVYRSHRILFEQCFRMAAGEKAAER